MKTTRTTINQDWGLLRKYQLHGKKRTFGRLPVAAWILNQPSFIILLNFSKDFCLHFIIECYWVWYQSMMFLYSQLHVNKRDTTHNRQQQAWPGTQAVQCLSSVRLVLFSVMLLHRCGYQVEKVEISSWCWGVFFSCFGLYLFTMGMKKRWKADVSEVHCPNSNMSLDANRYEIKIAKLVCTL